MTSNNPSTESDISQENLDLAQLKQGMSIYNKRGCDEIM